MRKIHKQLCCGSSNPLASLKESAVHSWQTNLQSDLETIASGLIDIDQVEILLSQANADAVYQNAYNQLKQRITDHMQKTDFYSEVMIADPAGRSVFSTDDASQGKNVKKFSFQPSSEGSVLVPPVTKEGQGNLCLWPCRSKLTVKPSLYCGHANLDQLNKIMTERIGLGNTGETYLVNSSHHLITDLLFEGYKAGESYIFSSGIDQALYKNSNSSGSLCLAYRVQYVLGVYR